MSRADYASSRLADAAGGLVSAVEPGSPADRAGVVPGDRILAADGAEMRDVLDWQWSADGSHVELTLEGAGGRRTAILERERDEGWGIDFAHALFDGVHTCRNTCAFCFMTQLPPGMRASLYLRDDDYRLSFLQGNFISLTNLDDGDVVRIGVQRLSPLYVSLHAVDPDVRRQLVCATEDRALERFDELLGEGIDLHVQIVLVPGVNDAEQLDHTLTWLAEREGVASVGIVPLGFTRHQNRFDESYNDPIAAATVIQQVQRWQFAMKERDGVAWVYLADEFYLNARAPIPTTEWYDDYPQYENGIGLVRSFVDEASGLRAEFERAVRQLPEGQEAVTVVTGVMAATTLAGALQAFGAVGRVRLLCVPNRYFGGNVAVTGLLTGEDLIAGLTTDGPQGIYLVPDVMFNADGLTLDGLTLDDVRERSGARVRLVSSDAAGLLEGLGKAAAELV